MINLIILMLMLITNNSVIQKSINICTLNTPQSYYGVTLVFNDTCNGSYSYLKINLFGGEEII